MLVSAVVYWGTGHLLHAGESFLKIADVIDECPPLAKLFEGNFLQHRFQDVLQVGSVSPFYNNNKVVGNDDAPFETVTMLYIQMVSHDKWNGCRASVPSVLR